MHDRCLRSEKCEVANMRTKAKQLLSIILSLTMLICTMPLEVLATEDMGESFLSEAEIGEDILKNDSKEVKYL